MRVYWWYAHMFVATIVGLLLFVYFFVTGFQDHDAFMGGWLCIALSHIFEQKAKEEEGRNG